MFLSIRHEEELKCLQSARDVNQLLGVPDFENAKSIYVKKQKKTRKTFQLALNILRYQIRKTDRSSIT